MSSPARQPTEPSDSADPGVQLKSEFASVVVSVDREAMGPRLRIENLQNGRCLLLDPLELASLTWLSHTDFDPFLDPSKTGWPNPI